MSTIEISTAVAAPEEPQLQSGDLVTTVNPERLWFGRVFDVGQGTVRVWWSGFHGLPAVEGLVAHQTSEVRFVERPVQYVAVVFETPQGDRYRFVSAGGDVTLEESAFELAPQYTIVSRRTTATIRESDTTSSEDGNRDVSTCSGESEQLPDAE